MKRVLGIVAMFFVMTMTMNLFAQDPGRWAKKVSKEVAEMTQVMKLDTAQQSKMTKLLTEFYVERDAARQKEGDERKQAMRAANKKKNDGFAAICTPEQQDLWKKHCEEKASQNNKKK